MLQLLREKPELSTPETAEALTSVLRSLKAAVFIKDEPYDRSDPRRRPRLIISRDSTYKKIFGPFFKPIENRFFTLP